MLRQVASVEEIDLAPLHAIRDRWMDAGRSTAPVDERRAEEALRDVYRAVGLAPPSTFEWHDSPLSAARSVYGERGDRDTPSVRARIYDAEEQIRAVWDYVANFFALGGLRSARRTEAIETEVRWPVHRAVAVPLYVTLSGAGRSGWSGPFRDSSWVPRLEVGYGHMDADCWATAEAAASLGLIRIDRFLPWLEVARNAGWWWPGPEVCVVCRRPVRFSVDADGALHDAQEPALRWADGSGIWAWHGVPVSPEVIEDPSSVDPLSILAEPDVAIRRVMAERFGWLRLARAFPPKRTRDRYGTLYRWTGCDGEDLVAVRVRNATPDPDGRYRRYFLCVPPGVDTPREAVAWTFRLGERFYQPRAET